MNHRALPARRLALTVAALLVACGKSQIDWKEEVKLQVGETVIVKRTAKTKAFGEVGGPGGWENEGMSVLIIEPKRADNPPLWQARFVPLLFDRDPDNGQWFVVATFYSCSSWYDLGRPTLPYTEFRLKDGRWVQGLLTPALIGREGNMLTMISSKGEPDHTLASKAAVMSDARISADSKRIVSTWKTGC